MRTICLTPPKSLTHRLVWRRTTVDMVALLLLFTSLLHFLHAAVIGDPMGLSEVSNSSSIPNPQVPVPHVSQSDHIKGVTYGPSVGISKKKPDYLYWTDERFLSTYYEGLDYQTISTMKCTRKTDGGRLIGLQAAYRIINANPKKWSEHSAEYHGWKNWIGLRMKTLSIHLDTQHSETINKVTYRVCGRHWEGIKIETTKKQSLECGDWDHTKDAQDKSCAKRDGGTLEPLAGTMVIGLYGEAKQRSGSIEQGIRGLGFLTIPVRN